MTFDVVVAGGGTAGMTVAIFAAQRGANVLVVELAPRLGGALHVCRGELSAAGTRLQAAQGIHDAPQLHYDDAMRISRGTANQRMLRELVDNAPDTLHWLLQNGFEVMPDHPVISYAHEPYKVPRTYFGPERGLSVLKAMLPLYQSQERAGRITTRLVCEVLGVERDAAGAVTGLRFRSKGSEPESASGRNVVLALGGFASHAERFREWTGHPLWRCSYEYARGDGHAIGLEAGSYLKHADKFLCEFAGIRSPRDPTHVGALSALTPQLRRPWELYLNREGRRFMREDDPSADNRDHRLLEQTQQSFWAVYDAGIVQAAPQPFITAFSPEEVARLWNVHDSFRRGGTIEELARRCDLNPVVLRQSIRDYNAAVAASTDDAFGREHLPKLLGNPPFYAVLHHGMSVSGWAGLAADENFRVLDRNDAPIPNLRAVGELLGFGLVNGNAFLSGLALQSALTFGRLLGQELLSW